MSLGHIVTVAVWIYVTLMAIIVFFFGEKIKPLKFLRNRRLNLGIEKVDWYMQRFLTVYFITLGVLVALWIIVAIGGRVAYLITMPVS